MAATQVRDYAQLAQDICNAVGADNIVEASHCATRLRLVLKKEPSQATEAAIARMPGVIKVQEVSGQFQVVIGMHAKDVYENLAKLVDVAPDGAASPQKQGVLDSVIATMSAVFAPFVYLLAGAGLIQGALIIITTLWPAVADTTTYSVLSFISWTPFTFLPILIGITASKHFHCNTFIAVACCAALCNADSATIAGQIADGQTLTFLGIPLAQTTYTSTVLPPLIMVWVLSYFERFLNRHVNEVVQPILVPFICMVVMVPLTILLIGPVSDAVANGIAVGYNWLVQTVPAIAAVLVGGIWQVFVIFGVHWGVTPMVMADFANNGCDTFQAFQTCAVIGQVAIAFAVFFKSRDRDLKNVSLSAGVTGIFGITEPTIYGVTLPLKKTFVMGCVAGALGALVISFFGTAYYAYAGLPGILTVVNAISPEHPLSFVGMLAGVAVTIVVAFAEVFVLGLGDKKEGVEAATAATNAIDSPAGIEAPVTGSMEPLSSVSDPMFASKAMGDGIAVVPSAKTGECEVCAPFGGEVVLAADTAHAYGIRAADGVQAIVHIGIDTVKLGGEGFSAFVKPGDHVAAGQTLCTFDPQFMAEKGLDMTVMVILVDPAGHVLANEATGAVTAGEQVASLVLEKGADARVQPVNATA